MKNKIKQKKSILQTYNRRITIIAVLTACILSFFWITGEISRFQSESSKQRQSYLTSRKLLLQQEINKVFDYLAYKNNTTENRLKNTIKTRTYEAHAIASSMYANYHKNLSEKELKKLIIETLRSIRFNGDRGYYFATDFNGIEILFSDKPELEGKNMLSLVSSDGVQVVREMIKTCRESSEGFISYHWTKPGVKGNNHPKIAFVKKFEPYDWLFGTGEYLDNVEQDIKNETLTRINKIIFDNNGCVFAFDYNGKVLSHGFQPRYIGKNLWHLEDHQGTKIIQQMKKKAADSKGGFLQYHWWNPQRESSARKLTYVREYKDWQWIIGSDSYIDEIDTIIASNKKQLKQKIKNSTIKISSLLLLMLAVVSISSRLISKRAEKSFTAFAVFLHQAAGKMVHIDPQILDFSEFTTLAMQANRMVKAREIIQNQLHDAQENLEQKVEERTAELKEAKNYIKKIVDSMPSVLVGIDEEEIINLWNRQAEIIFKISSAEALGGSLLEILPILSPEIAAIRETISRSTLQANIKFPMAVKDRNGYIEMTVYPVAVKKQKGAVIRLDDISEKVRLEEMMIQTEKMLSVGSLAAGMAQELHNPLAGIMQNIQVVSNRLTSSLPANIKAAEQCETNLETILAYVRQRGITGMITMIREAGLQANEIIANILSFSLQSESQFLHHDIAALLDKALEITLTDHDLKKKYNIKKIDIVRKYDHDLAPVPCDPAKILQVFLNILKNGIQAMLTTGIGSKGGNSIPRFILRTTSQNNGIRIEIEDNGPGVSREVQKRIFEPFFTTKEVGNGRGLGLAVSYFIITENHNGKLFIESEPDRGSKFIIQLPINST